MNFYRVYAKIDLDAIEHNINILKNKLGGKAKLLYVVKARAGNESFRCIVPP